MDFANDKAKEIFDKIKEGKARVNELKFSQEEKIKIRFSIRKVPGLSSEKFEEALRSAPIVFNNKPIGIITGFIDSKEDSCYQVEGYLFYAGLDFMKEDGEFTPVSFSIA